MHGANQTRARDENGKKGHQPTQQSQSKIEAPKDLFVFFDEEAMQQGGAGEPGQERCGFNRIPSPITTPAKHLICPPTAQGNASC